MADSIRAVIDQAYAEVEAERRRGDPQIIDRPDRGEQPKPNGTPQPYPFTLLRDMKPRLERREIVKGVIPAGGLGCAYGDPSSGKTAILLDMALHIAAGLEYRERTVQEQPVIFVALEGHAGIENRIIAAAAEIDVDDAPLALVIASDDFRDPATSRRVAANAKLLGGQPLIIIDTYAAALAGGSDCDPADVGALIQAVKAELQSQGCTVMVIHHTGKDAGRGARGWSGLLAACDFEFEVSRDDDLRTLRVSKMRDGSDSQPAFCYQLAARDLGLDQDGEPVTAVVVEHLADKDRTRSTNRHSPKARAALNELWACIKDPSRSWPLPDEPGLKCTTMDVWEKACLVPGTISKAREEKERRYKFRSAMAELREAGAIVTDSTDGQRVYPAPKARKDGR